VSSDGKLRFSTDYSPAATVSQQSTGIVWMIAAVVMYVSKVTAGGNWLTS